MSKGGSTLSKQHSILLLKTATKSNEFIVKYSPFNKVECCFEIVAVLGNNVERNFVFRQRRNKLNMFNWLRLYRKDEISRKSRSILLPKTATMSKQPSTLSKQSFDLYVAFGNVASTLLLVWTTRVCKLMSTMLNIFFSLSNYTIMSCGLSLFSSWPTLAAALLFVPRRDAILLRQLPSARRYKCRSSSGWRRRRPLVAMSSLAFPEVALWSGWTNSAPVTLIFLSLLQHGVCAKQQSASYLNRISFTWIFSFSKKMTLWDHVFLV